MRLNIIVATVALLVLTAPVGAVGQTAVQIPPSTMTCPADVLVWVNTRSGVYHYRGERYFGSTKYGKFICEKAARAEGDRPTRNGQ